MRNGATEEELLDIVGVAVGNKKKRHAGEYIASCLYSDCTCLYVQCY